LVHAFARDCEGENLPWENEGNGFIDNQQVVHK
jgi:hypothetical protein